MPIRLNIGCGTAPTDGWINYDNSPVVRIARWPMLPRFMLALRLIDPGQAEFAHLCRARGVRYANAVARIPHADGSVDVIYSCHMIEHLDRHEARRFLAECRRVLRPGGVIRLVVPDLRITVRDYVAKGNADTFVEHLQLALDKPHGFSEYLRYLLVGSRNHRWLYDGKSMSKLLLQCGFGEVVTLQAGETRIQAAGMLDLFERAGESAYVEGTRVS